ncbi:MAG: hypothetical protein GY816_16320 [Cytophagales bacterium]|nr:hypothetical protein [Cytophagales bacterium]
MNGKVIAEQRLGLEQHRINTDAANTQYAINTEAQLEHFRIVQSFTLWGFLLSIPLVIILLKAIKWGFGEWKALSKMKIEYKLKEIAAAEKLVATE